MKRSSVLDSNWPVILSIGLMSAFTLGMTPRGQMLVKEISTRFRDGAAIEQIAPPRPEVLLFTRNPEAQNQVATTVVPRGYRVLLAPTVFVAQQLLRSDANRIGLIVVDTETGEAERLADLAQAAIPAARVIRLPRNHGSTEVSAMLLNAI